MLFPPGVVPARCKRGFPFGPDSLLLHLQHHARIARPGLGHDADMVHLEPVLEIEQLVHPHGVGLLLEVHKGRLPVLEHDIDPVELHLA